MAGKGRRLQKVASALSARERALLVLRAWKEGKEEDPSWRLSMPGYQVREFNRYIGLMNGINQHLGPYVMHIAAGIEMLSLRLGWLATLLMWQWCVEQLAEYIQFETKEPVTESEYRELERKARQEMRPVGELAELLVERHEHWSEEDIAPGTGDHDEVMVTPEAWERVRAEKERNLGSLVAEGVLEWRGNGRSLMVQVGSFYDWLGETAPVEPPWAKEYEVVPDADADDARARRWSRERAREAYQRGPTAPVVHLEDPDMDFGEPSKIDELVGLHKERLRKGIEEHWGKLSALDRVVKEVSREFDGEDPALPELRHVLSHSSQQLAELHTETERCTGPFELPEPGEQEVDLVREIVERAGE